LYESKLKSAGTDRLYETILSLKSVEECYRFFDDLCTISELQAMTQRLEVASMLRAGKTFSQISGETGVSSATITRVNKCLSYGTGGYELALGRMDETDPAK